MNLHGSKATGSSASYADQSGSASASGSAGHFKPATGHQLKPSEVNLTAGKLSTGSKLKQLVIVGLFLVGLLVCVGSLICILLLPSFVSNQIAKRLVLKNNSLLLERWSKPNVPMFFKVWVWDVKNAQEIIDKRGTKAELREIGPFVFNLRRQKDIVSFAGENLYYTERKIYHFNQELSCCSINTTVTIPNIPLIAVVDRALSYNLPLVGRFIPRLINRAIQSLREQLFVKKQVREILFDGYEVELLKMVSRVGSLVGMPQTQQKFALLKGRNDTWRPEQDGVWAINTGARDRKQFGKVSSWNSYRQLPFWAAPGCNTINGSDGTLFPPPIKRSEPLYIFNQELCRTVNLAFERPSEVRSIKAYRFVLNPLNFAHTMAGQPPGGAMGLPAARARVLPFRQKEPAAPSAEVSSKESSHSGSVRPAASEARASLAQPPQIVSTNKWLSASQQQPQRRPKPADPSQPASPAEQQRLVKLAQENQAQVERQAGSARNPLTCFCDRKSTNLNGVNVCEFDGLIELSKCTKQAQVIFGSMPHFFQSDPRLANQVSGMQPNASKHTTYLDIEPNTGLVLGGKRRVQLNIIVKHNNEVDGFENINDMLLPVVWFEESAQIPEESAAKFKSLYTDRIRLVNIVLTTLFLASLGLLAVDIRLLASHYGHCYRRFKMNYAAGTGMFLAKTGSGPATAPSASKLRGDESSSSLEALAANRAGSLYAPASGVDAGANYQSRSGSCSSADSNNLDSPLLGESGIGSNDNLMASPSLRQAGASFAADHQNQSEFAVGPNGSGTLREGEIGADFLAGQPATKSITNPGNGNRKWRQQAGGAQPAAPPPPPGQEVFGRQ